MCKTWLLKITENGFDFRPLAIIRTEPKPKLEWIRKMSREPLIMAIFDSTLYDKNWYDSFKILPTFDLMTSSMTSWVRNTWLVHLCIPTDIPASIVCVAPVLHSEIVRTNIVTNTQGENIITSLSRVITISVWHPYNGFSPGQIIIIYNAYSMRSWSIHEDSSYTIDAPI